MWRRLLSLFSGRRGLIFGGALLLCSAFIFIISNAQTQIVTPGGLLYQQALARWDPILALPGVNPEELLQEVVGLRTTAEEVASRQSDTQIGALVREALYPLRFLTALAELEKARLSFLGSGSQEDYKAYYAAQDKALGRYLSDLERFRRAFAMAVPVDIGQYATEKKIITRENTLLALDTLRSNALEVQRKLRERGACLSEVSLCPQLTMPSFSSSQPMGATGEELSQTRRVQSLFTRAGYPIKNTPLILLSQSACIVERPKTALLFGFVHLPAIGVIASSTSPIYLGDIRFVDSTKYATLPFFKYFTQQDVTFTPSDPLSQYACADSYKDVGAVLAIRDVGDFAITSRLSQYVSGAPGNALRAIEREFEASEILLEESSKSYLQGALANLEALPLPLQHDVATLSIQMETKSRGLLHVVHTMQFYEKTNMLISRKGLDIDFGALYFFFTRSGFVSLFLSDGLYVENDIPALFKPNDLPSERQPYLYYSSMNKTPALEKKLIHDMQIYHATHEITPY